MKSNKNLIIIIALTIIAVVGVFLIIKNIKTSVPNVSLGGSTTSVDLIPTNPDVNLSEAPEEAVTQQNASTSKNSICQSLRSSYANLSEVKKKEKVDLRFVNVHKNIDGVIYRLRFFYKDSSENETPTYLVYKENQNDEDILTEKSAYKKGKLYNKIEKAQGEIIYTEEGMNIGKDQDLFLHYENNVLKDLQGISPFPNEKDFIECRFTNLVNP